MELTQLKINKTNEKIFKLLPRRVVYAFASFERTMFNK